MKSNDWEIGTQHSRAQSGKLGFRSFCIANGCSNLALDVVSHQINRKLLLSTPKYATCRCTSLEAPHMQPLSLAGRRLRRLAARLPADRLQEMQSPARSYHRQGAGAHLATQIDLINDWSMTRDGFTTCWTTDNWPKHCKCREHCHSIHTWGLRCRHLNVRLVTSATAAAGDTLRTNYQQDAQPMSIVFVSAEVGPWSKTGGLGDVTGGAAQSDHALICSAVCGIPLAVWCCS